MAAELTLRRGTDPRLVLVTGVTGIGGRLVPRLLEAGYAVRCLARVPRKVTDRPWAVDPRVDVRAGDLSGADTEATVEGARGCRAAYYLVHSRGAPSREAAARNRDMARRFAEVAERAGLERTIYLGPLGDGGDGPGRRGMSPRPVERALASGTTPVTVLRATMSIGSGSAGCSRASARRRRDWAPRTSPRGPPARNQGPDWRAGTAGARARRKPESSASSLRTRRDMISRSR